MFLLCDHYHIQRVSAFGPSSSHPSTNKSTWNCDCLSSCPLLQSFRFKSLIKSENFMQTWILTHWPHLKMECIYPHSNQNRIHRTSSTSFNLQRAFSCYISSIIFSLSSIYGIICCRLYRCLPTRFSFSDSQSPFTSFHPPANPLFCIRRQHTTTQLEHIKN